MKRALLGSTALALAGACNEFVSATGPDAGPGEAPAPDAAVIVPDAGSPPGSDAATDAAMQGDGGDVEVPPPPVVQTMASGLADVVAFSVEGTQLLWLSSSQGVRTCVLGACDSDLVVSPNDALLPPVLLRSGRVYYAETYSVLGPVTGQRLVTVALDGTGRSVVVGGNRVGPQLAFDDVGVLGSYSHAVAENVYGNVLVRWDGQNADAVLAQNSAVVAPFVVGSNGALVGIAARSGGTMQLQRVVDGHGAAVGTAKDVTDLALDDRAIYALSATAISECTGTCSTLLAPGDAGATFAGIALRGATLAVGLGASLQVCTVGAAPVCAPGPDVGLGRILDVQVSDGQFYVLGTEPGPADAAVTMAVRRVAL